ncbi:hypothetical protein BKA67DRAFT_659811 [Truncatella angustata]|uniref:RRM domain-containing protein n=1 Tax=Truncatella angustata TaxID=152316 RepID=A0A9P8UJ65_9PEZI|nr:uncharacterized protein BKA67DRAFT_659811 [Truncatella angustata]KAH6653172.1 hypothetical protein BKA67DRAFT_659811 [Truncatella angustata]
MADSPEVVATAGDLTPQSPKPINLSSPAAVPGLQDQADSLSTMALFPTTEEAPLASIANTTQLPGEPPLVQDQAENNPNASFQEAIPIRDDASKGHDHDEKQDAPAEARDQDQDQGQDEDEDHYAKDFDSPVPITDVAIQDSAASVDGHVAADDTIEAGSPSTLLETPTADEDTSASQALATSTSTLQDIADATQSISTAVVPQDVSQHVPTVETAAPPQPTDDGGIDIQALVDNITAHHNATRSNEGDLPAPSETTPGVNPAANTQSSLPPKPPASQQSAAASHFQPNASTAVPSLTPTATFPYSYPPPGAAAPGFPTPQTYPNPAAPMPIQNPYGAVPIPGANSEAPSQSQRYEEFLKEERKYVSEAKWDRFPEGSRLFIGNLSSERVTKREVFDIFSRFGRLAQISLKQAYGFVQYHAVTEGQAATDALQGIEISGRKIHLEFSRTQKKEGDNDRRGGTRGGRGGSNQNDRDRNRLDSRRNDGYRPREPSPNRGVHSRQGSYGRGDRAWDGSSDHQRRGRSRSPQGYDGGSYRRRSPSPYRRGPPTSEDDLDIPRRFGGDVPDVQLLLLQEVNRDFVGWVQGAFIERGLKVEVMFLNPRFPRDLVIQRQVVEGVHGVIELDFRSQTVAKVPLQTFDRSAGRHNARFDQYQDLDPKIAAEIVARAKSQTHLQSPAVYGGGQYPPVHYQPQPQMPPQQYPAVHSQLPAGLNLGGLDNATLQRVLSAVQGGPQAGIPGQLPMGAAPGVDVNAVLSALGANGTAPNPSHQHPHAYQQAPASGNPADQAHVQNIMAQLSRYRH